MSLLGNYEDSLLCYTESLQWADGLCGVAEQIRALVAAAAVMTDLGRHTAIAAETAEAEEAAKAAAAAAAAATPSNRKGGAAAAAAAAAVAAGTDPGASAASLTAAAAVNSSSSTNSSSSRCCRSSWRPLRSLMASHRRALSIAETRGLRYCRRALESVLLLSPGHLTAAARLIKVMLLQGDFPAAAKALQHVLQQQLSSGVHTPRKILWLRGLLHGDAAAASAAANFLASAQSVTNSKSNSSSSVDAAAAAEAQDNDLAAQFLSQQQQRLKRQLLALKAEGRQTVSCFCCCCCCC